MNNNKISGLQFALSISDYKLPIQTVSEFRFILSELLSDIKTIDHEDNPSKYNRQWRHFGSNVNDENGVDQISSLIKLLKEKPSDRRKLLVALNPSEPKTQALTHCLLQFHVAGEKLSCKLYQSRADLRNVVQYDCSRAVLLTYILCHVTGLVPDMFVHSLGELCFDAHVNGVDRLMEVDRQFARVTLSKDCRDIDEMSVEHFQLELDAIATTGNDLSRCYSNSCALNDPTRHEELQYIDLVKEIIDKGTRMADRTGCGTVSIFGPQMVFSLRDGIVPLLTTKRVFYRAIIEELLWFLRGSTDGNELASKNVRIWDANGSKEFLTSLGLGHRQEGDLGPVYGFQWRHFGARYVDMATDYSGQGVDQIANVIESIKANRDGTNHVVIAWNPKDLPLMALPPCHCLMQFFVENEGNELSCKLYQRSGDMGLGVPFNIASYALLTHMVAHIVGLKPGRFIHSLGDTHVYLNHIDPIAQQLTREPRPFPTLTFRRNVSNIEDFQVEDFLIENYDPHPKIAMQMAV